MKSIKDEYPDEVGRLENEHAGRFLEPSEVRDLLTVETPMMIFDGAPHYLDDSKGDLLKWVKISRTDLFDRVWTVREVCCEEPEEDYGAILSDRVWTARELCREEPGKIYQHYWQEQAEEAYGAILSDRDGLILIDSLTDG